MPRTNQQKIDWARLQDLVKHSGYTFESLSLEMAKSRSWLSNAKRDDKWLENSEIKHICLVIKCSDTDFLYSKCKTSEPSSLDALDKIRIDIAHISEDMEWLRENYYVNLNSKLDMLSERIRAIADTQGDLLDYAEQDHSPNIFAKTVIGTAIAQNGTVSYKDMEKIIKILNISNETFQAVKSELGLAQFSKREGADNHPVSYWKKEVGYKL